jgi:hypothetical protein
MGQREHGDVWRLNSDTDLSPYQADEETERRLRTQARAEQLTRRAEIYTALYRRFRS